jgi:hypothetical protein
MQSNTPPPRYRPPLKRPAALDGASSASFVGRCPYLGTTADAGTALAFASDAHRCYSTRLPVPVSAVHQQNYCLSGGYTECPVFQQSLRAGQPVPMVTEPPSWGVPQEETVTNVVLTPMRSRSDDRRRSALLPLLLLLALLAGGWWLWHGFLSQPETTARPAVTDLAVGAATATPEDAALGSVTGDSGQVVVAANATATAVSPPPTDEAPRPDSGRGISLPTLPTASAVVGVAQAAECSIPEWWVPYIVQSNDTLLDLAQLRGLAAEDLLQGNCLGLAELVAGQVILLPPLATVIGLTPFAPVVAVTRVPNTSGGGSIIIVATQSPATTQPIVPPTPVATADNGSPNQSTTSAPPRPTTAPPTAVAPTVTPTNASPTVTPPILFPTATPGSPGSTATPPSTVPTATPPFEGPTQTPPPVRP